MKPHKLTILPRIMMGLAFLSAGIAKAAPKIVSAIAWESQSSNRVYVTFNELLLPTSATNTGNYSVTLLGTTNQVLVQGVSYSPGPGQHSTVVLHVGTNNWHPGVSDYYLTVNHVQNRDTNTIAPDTRIGISWPQLALVLDPGAVWEYSVNRFADSEQPWFSCDDKGKSWAAEPGPFGSGGGSPADYCFPPRTGLGPNGPIAFRTTFVCPAEYAADGLLRFDYLVSGGVVFYLNGAEVLRVNLCSAPVPVTNTCCVSYSVAPPPCGSRTAAATNLVAGTNCLAALVFPDFCLGPSSDGDWAFGVRLSAVRLRMSPLPAEEPAVLRVAPISAGAVRLWWVGSGYALESATNLVAGEPAPGPPLWIETPDVSNPYTNQTGATRFFRLRR